MTKRCAIYTRKSTDEGLDQSFNSLDAQREACAAFVKSQKHEGWRLVSTAYDDGGYSGGSMDRPALQSLMADITKCKIDVVVVYKIDRLTRSLMDFARMVEIFDRQKVSFVSVTQQFNTTTSMGRLTLNVLLSFAQFEREVTAERIRDKITASKKKGMWMGGPPPLGYDVKDRQLIVNHEEAVNVKKLFDAYLRLGSIRQLKVWADLEGIVTKRRIRSGEPSGGKPYWLGNLCELLCNCIYVGQVRGHGTTYKGLHEPIIDPDVWEKVQVSLQVKAVARTSPTNLRSGSLLIGKLFDESGERLSPTSTTKQGRRYQYYVTRGLLIGQKTGSRGWRLPAKAIEDAVFQSTCHYLNADIRNYAFDADLSVLLREHTKSERTLDSNRRTQIFSMIAKVEILEDRLRIKMRFANHKTNEDPGQSNEAVSFEVPVQLRRRGVEAKLMIPSLAPERERRDPVLVRTMSLAWSWFQEIRPGILRDAVKRGALSPSEMSRILPLAFLSPLLVERILSGTQPIHLTTETLKRSSNIPVSWRSQLSYLATERLPT
jgi:DNA invertase Pin-like site-specific DNA recombinase